jgi:hypothetical protein
VAAGYLGQRAQTGVTNLPSPRGSGLWVVRFTPRDLYPDDFEVYHMAVTGPGGNFWVYVDDALYSVADRGDINEWDPAAPMFVRRGQQVFFYWSIGSGSAPTVWLYCQQPGASIR